MSRDLAECPLCSERQLVARNDFKTEVYYVECPNCGSYEVSEEAVDLLTEGPKYLALDSRKYLLSGLTRAASDRGQNLKILTTNIEELIASATPPRGPLEAVDRVLKLFDDGQPTWGDFISHSAKDYPLVYARSGIEYGYFIEQARSLGYLETTPQGTRLTIEGWRRLEELRQASVYSDQAFVAMWFDDEMKEAQERGFEAALTEAGFTPLVMNNVEHDEKIDDRIIAEIRKSGLIVADFTGGRGGVYYEAGFARGLGIKVISTCRKDWMKQLHFDTRQYNHIEWETPEELKEKLLARIEANIPLPRNADPA